MRYLVDFSNIANARQVIVTIVAGIRSGATAPTDSWIFKGKLPNALRQAVEKFELPVAFEDQGYPIPGDVRDMTTSLRRITEIERGTAKYICDTPEGRVAIGYFGNRYRVEIAGKAYGAFGSPEEALDALTHDDMGRFLVDHGPRLALFNLPKDLSAWSLENLSAYDDAPRVVEPFAPSPFTDLRARQLNPQAPSGWIV